MEILLVITLIAVISGILIKNMTGIVSDQGPILADAAVNRTIPTALIAYRNKEGKYPATLSEVAQKYGIEDDPWGNAYEYKYPGTHNKGSYDLWSKGPDGSSGTADDIGNW